MEIMEHEPVESLRNRYIAATLISLISFCCGNAIGWLSPALLTLRHEKSPFGRLSEREISIIASCLCFGGFIGTPLYSYITEKYGRRICSLASAVPFMISWMIMYAATSSGEIMLARTFAGVGCTGAMIVVPVYLNEISQFPKESKLQLLANIANNAGIFLEYVLGNFLAFSNVIWFNLIIPVIFFVIFVWIPDSPIYLIRKKKIEEATDSVAWLMNLPVNSYIVKENLDNLRLNNIPLNENNSKNHILKEFLYFWSTQANFRESFYKCLVLFTLQGCIGIFAILSFATDIFKHSGGILPYTTMPLIISAQQLVSSCISILLMKRLDKKTRLMGAFFVSSIALLSFGTYNFLKTNGYTFSLFTWVPLLSTCVAVVMFASGIAIIPFQILSESFNIQMHKIVNAIILMWMWFIAFLVSQFYNCLFQIINIHGTFWIYGCVAAIGAIYVFFFFHKKSEINTEITAGPYSIEMKISQENISDTLL